MSTGSLFHAIQGSLDLLLETTDFKELCEFKHHPAYMGMRDTQKVQSEYDKHVTSVHQNKAKVDEIRRELTNLQKIYNNFILDLSLFAKADHVAPDGTIKDIEKLKAFQENITTFRQQLASTITKINDSKLDPYYQNQLTGKFDTKSIQATLTNYHTQLQETFNALDLSNRIENLTKEAEYLNKSLARSENRRIRKNKTSDKYTPFHLHKKGDSKTLDIEKIAVDIELQRNQMEAKQEREMVKKNKYDGIGLVCGLLCLSIVALPIFIIPAVIFLSKSGAHERKATVQQYRLSKLEQIETDIRSIQGAWHKLEQDPTNITMEIEGEVKNKIKDQVATFQKDLQFLTTALEVDITERPKHSRPSRT